MDERSGEFAIALVFNYICKLFIQDLVATTDRLRALDSAFEDTHKLATQLFHILKEVARLS